MDYAFSCKYVVLSNLYNTIENDTIEFKAYDHYGRPEFAEFDEVILYISKDEDGNYYHQKYQYDNVYRDSENKLISYPKFLGVDYQKYKLESFSIKFPKNYKHSLRWFKRKWRGKYYPRKYYKIKNNYAYPIRGISIDELLKYRLNTSFKDL